MRTAALALLLSLLQPTAFTMRELDKGQESGVERHAEAVARTDQDWRGLWGTHAGARPAPSIDLSKEMVIALFLGTKPTAGYGADILSVTPDGDGAVVRYRERAPSPDTMAAQVLTSPYHIVAVPRVSGTVRFIKVEN